MVAIARKAGPAGRRHAAVYAGRGTDATRRSAEPVAGAACPENHPGPAVAVPHVLAGLGETPCQGGSPMNERSWSPEEPDIGAQIGGLRRARATGLYSHL